MTSPPDAPARILVNGEHRDVPAGGTTVAEVVTALAAPASGVAVAVDGEVLHREAWPTTRLVGGEQVEVITAMQGG